MKRVIHNEDKEKKEESIFEKYPLLGLYSTSYAMVIVLFMAAFCLIFKNDPPAFPLPKSADPIDCAAIDLLYIEQEESRIKLGIQVHDFIEYPKTVAYSMIHILVKTGSTVIDFKPQQFWDLESHSPNITFCILHAINGPVQVEAFCQRRKLGSAYFEIADATIFPVGWSRAISSFDNLATLYDFCLKNNEILFFSQPKDSYMAPLRVGLNAQLNVIPKTESAENYRTDHTEMNYYEPPTVIVATKENELWQHLINVLIPTFLSIAEAEDFSAFSVGYIHRQPELEYNMKLLIPNDPIDLTNQCFDHARFLLTAGSIPYYRESEGLIISEAESLATQFYRISNADPNALVRFRNIYARKQKMIKNRIVLDFTLQSMESLVQECAPDCEIVVLPEGREMDKVAKTIASSNIFITAHLTSAIYGIFLNAGASMIEISPKNCECKTFGKKYAQKVGAKYIPYYNNIQKCPCENELYYFTQKVEYAPLEKSRLEFSIKAALND